jgi:hypothetical protein
MSSLDQLRNVNARHELKWVEEGLITQADVHHVLDRNASALRAIEAVSHDPNAKARIRGSKLIFEPYRYYAPAMFANLSGVIELEVRLIHLKRDYLDVWLSWKVRGVYHEFTLPFWRRFTANMFGTPIPPMPKPDLLHVALWHGDRRLDDSSEDVRPYQLATAADDLLQLYANDMQLLAFGRGRGGLVVDYGEIDTRFAEIVRHIGARAGPFMLSRIRRRPHTRKLPGLQDYLHPVSPLHNIAAALDRCFAEAAKNVIDPAAAFAWRSDTEIAITVPYVVDTFVAAGLAAGEKLVWPIQRPRVEQ